MINHRPRISYLINNLNTRKDCLSSLITSVNRILDMFAAAAGGNVIHTAALIPFCVSFGFLCFGRVPQINSLSYASCEFWASNKLAFFVAVTSLKRRHLCFWHLFFERKSLFSELAIQSLGAFFSSFFSFLTALLRFCLIYVILIKWKSNLVSRKWC